MNFPWFRMYTEVLNDPKIQGLSHVCFKAWVNLLCIAGESGGSIIKADIAFKLRMPQKQVDQILTDLGPLLDAVSETEITPHNWDGRQFQSDSSNVRVKRFRERKRNGHSNGDVTLHETVPDQTRPDTDTEHIPPTPFSAPPQKAKTGLLDDFQEFRTAAAEAGMGGTPIDMGRAQCRWRLMDFSQKAAALKGIQDRIDQGEFDDPRYIPLAKNYLEEERWKRPIRTKAEPETMVQKMKKAGLM